MQLFVDENKVKGFTIAATLVPGNQIKSARKRLKQLCLSGQRSLHFRNESDSRRRKIISEIQSLDLKVAIIHAHRGTVAQNRKICLERLVALAGSLHVSKIILELDETYLDFDTKVLIRAIAAMKPKTEIVFTHLPRHAEPLLWVSDAVVWCENKGGEFQRRIEEMLILREKNAL